jgi:hypothetical protein
MLVRRIVAVLVLAMLLIGCSREPSAAALTATGVANLRSAKSAHLDGIGSIALRAQSGGSFSFEFKLSGDAELPNKARMNVQMALLGMSFNVDTIVLDGREYTKDAATGKWTEGSGKSSISGVMDPLGNIDTSFIHDVVEVDRPEVDGRKTRHLRYQADTAKMIDGLSNASKTTTQSVTNAQGIGELWIRIDDAQIVRQLVKVTVDVDGLAGFDLPGATSNLGKSSLEMSLDMRFSHHGEAVPQITAPPVGR